MSRLNAVSRWRWARLSTPLFLVPALFAVSGGVVCRSLLKARPTSPPATTLVLSPRPIPSRSAQNAVIAWPEQTLEGEPAKRLLLAFLTEARDRLEHIGSYTAVLLKRERIGGTVGPDETMEVKVRHHPFAVYLKYRGRKKGREVIYAEGKNDNRLVVHTGDWASRLVPRMTLEPTSTLAMMDNRHPITEAGLAHLTHKLLAAARFDLNDPDAVTVLDRVSDEGRSWLRSVQTYMRPHADRSLSRVEVRFDPVTGLPLRFTGDEWPDPEQGGIRQLGESYRYDDLQLDAGLTELDFNADNPAYAFAR